MYVTKVEHKVAVTPITLDMTANVDFDQLRKQFREVAPGSLLFVGKKVEFNRMRVFTLILFVMRRIG